MSTQSSERLRPLFARVLVRRRVEEKIGSLYVPPSVAKREATHRCEVLALGESCEAKLRVGDHVIISAAGGAWISPAGRGAAKVENELFIISEEDILAVVERAGESEQASAAALAATNS